MAELTDEEAISQAEIFLNHFRAAQRLEGLIRYIKNARKDFPEMQAKRDALLQEITTAETETKAAQERLKQAKAKTEPLIRQLTERSQSLASDAAALDRRIASLQGQATALDTTNREKQAKLDLTTASLATLTEEEKVLRVKVADHEKRLAELRQGAAKLLEG